MDSRAWLGYAERMGDSGRSEHGSVRRKLSKRGLFALFAVLAVAGFWMRSRLSSVPVTVARAVRGRAIDAVYATGTVEAEERVHIKAKISGSIAELFVRAGSPVKKGELLARIDNPAAKFDLERGKLELATASRRTAPQLAAFESRVRSVEAELLVAKQDLARSEELAERAAVARSALDQARARVGVLEANLESIRAEASSTAIDLTSSTNRRAVEQRSLAARYQDTEALAPMDGVVLARRVELGEVVDVNEELFTVGDVSRLILEVGVDEADVGRVFDGRTGPAASTAAVSLYAFPARTFAGNVFELLPDANRDRKSFLTKIRLIQPPAGLRSGMSAEVNVIVAEKLGVLLAPSAGIRSGKAWVIRDERAYQVPVNIGFHDLLRTEVKSGIAEGEAVVIDGADALADGDRVTMIERPLLKDAPLPESGDVAQNAL